MLSGLLALISVFMQLHAAAEVRSLPEHERMVEWTIESRKTYADPFNDVEVDVLFTRGDQSWRVPMFWRGGNQWTVRFAPPLPGEYAYQLQSTDRSNPDLNGRAGRVRVKSYAGRNALLRHGMLQVSANKRYFEHADGTPFFWLGDTWWQGLSDRLSWEGFQKLTADRKDKGFTVVQIVAGLVPLEQPPSDPGFCNEGGCVWGADFERINPRYFDFADRRILHLLDADIVPAIVGGWSGVLAQMGVAKMKRHWRYIIARYGAYPVFWISGGEIFDPPQDAPRRAGEAFWRDSINPGWTEVARYIRATDPYAHPFTVHEQPPPFDFPVQDESLMDFDLFQNGQRGWWSMAVGVAQLNLHYARTTVTKPLVQGEIGYEGHFNMHFEDFQRNAFWLAMLNGAAGHTYGADATWGAVGGDKATHRWLASLRDWEEGMKLPGSYQVGLGAKLLRQYQWWRFAPYPEWITSRGTTLLEPRTQINGFDLGTLKTASDLQATLGENQSPEGEWQARDGNFRQPYAAGIPGEVRFIYIPNRPPFTGTPPTVLGLERGVRYNAYLWDPSFGVRVDLGTVERPAAGDKIFADAFAGAKSTAWIDDSGETAIRTREVLQVRGPMRAVVKGLSEVDAVATVEAQSHAHAALLLRYRGPDDYVAAEYSPQDKSLHVLERRSGTEGQALGKISLPAIGGKIRLSIEVRGNQAAASLTNGERTYTTPIVDLSDILPGGAGLLYRDEDEVQSFDNFELRRSPTLVKDGPLQRKLIDAQGKYRGELTGPGWEDFGENKGILLDAYRPERLPTNRSDWILVLERQLQEKGVTKSDVN